MSVTSFSQASDSITELAVFHCPEMTTFGTWESLLQIRSAKSPSNPCQGGHLSEERQLANPGPSE